MNLTLEEIDYLYATPGKSARQVSKELRKLHKERGFNPEMGLAAHMEQNDTLPVEIMEHGDDKEKD